MHHLKICDFFLQEITDSNTGILALILSRCDGLPVGQTAKVERVRCNTSTN